MFKNRWTRKGKVLHRLGLQRVSQPVVAHPGYNQTRDDADHLLIILTETDTGKTTVTIKGVTSSNFQKHNSWVESPGVTD